MTRTEWLTFGGLVVATIAAIPGILAFFRSQPLPEESITFSFEKYDQTLKSDDIGAPFNKLFFSHEVGYFMAKNTSDKVIEVRIRPVYPASEVKEGNSVVPNGVFVLDAARSKILNMSQENLLPWAEKELMSNIFNKSGGDVEAYLKGQRKNVFGFGVYESYTEGVVCSTPSENIFEIGKKWGEHVIKFSAEINGKIKSCLIGRTEGNAF